MPSNRRGCSRRASGQRYGVRRCSLARRSPPSTPRASPPSALPPSAGMRRADAGATPVSTRACRAALLMPPMWASRNGHLDCVHTLPSGLAHRRSGWCCQLNTVNDNGSTALMVAATCGHAPIITALAEAGADLYVATSHNGSTALHLASSCGNVAAAEQLVRLDGPKQLLTATTAHGATPLHLAAHAASEPIIRILLDADADVHSKDRHRCARVCGVQQQHQHSSPRPLSLSLTQNSQSLIPRFNSPPTQVHRCTMRCAPATSAASPSSSPPARAMAAAEQQQPPQQVAVECIRLPNRSGCKRPTARAQARGAAAMRPRRRHAPQQSVRSKPCMRRQVVRMGQRKTLVVLVVVVAACVALKGLPFTPRTQPHQPRPLRPARHRASLPPRDD